MSNDWKQRKKCWLGQSQHSVWKTEGKIRQILYDDLSLLCYLPLFYYMMFACLTLKSTLSVHCSHNKVYFMDATLAAACNITHPLTRIKRSNLEVIYAAPYRATPHPIVASHPIEPRRTLQSYDAPYTATRHPTMNVAAATTLRHLRPSQSHKVTLNCSHFLDPWGLEADIILIIRLSYRPTRLRIGWRAGTGTTALCHNLLFPPTEYTNRSIMHILKKGINSCIFSISVQADWWKAGFSERWHWYSANFFCRFPRNRPQVYIHGILWIRFKCRPLFGQLQSTEKKR